MPLDLAKLHNSECMLQYQLEVTNKFQQLDKVSEPKTPDELWQELKDATLNAAKVVLQKDCIKLKNWISKDTFDLIAKKREAKTVTKRIPKTAKCSAENATKGQTG